MKYLYGFTKRESMKHYGPIGFEIPREGKGSVVTYPINTLGAIVGPVPCESFGGLNQETLVRVLLSHQETLEAIMREEFVLPCKFGTVISSEEELSLVLSRNQKNLKQWIHEMEDSYETNLIVSWDAVAMVKEIADKDRSIVLEKKRIEGLREETRESEKVFLGKKLSEKLKEKAEIVSNKILNELREITTASSVHSCFNESMILNASFLLLKKEEEHFMGKVHILDYYFEKKLSFKCVCPLPPYSFATVTLKRFDDRLIEEARELLDFNGGNDLTELKKVYKEKARIVHPDRDPTLKTPEAFKRVHEAYELLRTYYQGGGDPLQLILTKSEDIRP